MTTQKRLLLDWSKVTGLSFVKVLGINNTVVDGLTIVCQHNGPNTCENPIGSSDRWNWPTVANESKASTMLKRFLGEHCKETTQ
jgi:hypothetical protein